MIIAMILCPILLFALLAGVAYVVIKKTGALESESVKEENSKTIQDFIPLETLEDSIMLFKDGSMGRIIECSSTNYDLKTANEQASIEMIFQSFLNSLTFPISVFVQTRIIDNDKRMKNLREVTGKTVMAFPSLSDYREKYCNAMSTINETLGNSKQKKKFIIINYKDSLKVDNLTETERRNYAIKELNNRCSIVINGLASLGVSSTILNERGLCDLIYSTFNRDGYQYAENLNSSEALATFVQREPDEFTKFNIKKKVSSELLSVLNSLETYPEMFDELDAEDVEELKVLYTKKFNRMGVL